MPAKRLRYQPAPRPQNRTAPAPRPAADAPRDHSWFSIRNEAAANKAIIELYGYIGEPQSYRDYYTGEDVENPEGAGTLQEFAAALEAAGPVAEIELRIFSHGGDVYTGVAMHNLLLRHPANKVAIIDGLCASAATFPAMACDQIQIPSNAWMMVHTASIMAYGTAEDLRAEADRLDATNVTIANLYAARTGQSTEEMMAVMEAAKYLSGETAVAMGLADTLIEPVKNLASRAGTLEPTNCSALDHAPAEVLALFDIRHRFVQPKNQITPHSIPTPMSQPAASPTTPPAAVPTAQPSPANVVAPPSVPAPAPVATPAPAPVEPTPSPVNAAPINAADIAAAVAAQIMPQITALGDRLGIIEGQRQAGIDPANLAGASPTPNVIAPTGEGAPKAPLNLAGMTSLQKIAAGRQALLENRASSKG